MSRNVFLWGLYGFANTPLTVAIGGLYLAQWLILDKGIAEIWYSLAFVLATLLLLFTSPMLGNWSDKAGTRMPFLFWSTVILIITGILMGVFAILSLPVVVLILSFFAQYFYQASLIFYNALISKMSTVKTLGKISGIGDAFDEMGWIFGPAILLPFAAISRGHVFLPATVILVILGLPMFLWFREPITKAKSLTTGSFTFIFHMGKNITTYMLGFMLMSDALLTVSLYFAIVLDQLYKIDDTQKVVTMAFMQFVAIPSAFIIGRVSDRLGAKKLLILSCVVLAGIYFLGSIMSSPLFLYVLAFVVGFGYAGFYTTSRSLLAKMTPSLRHGEYFGIYSTFQKFASIIGPLLWGVVVWVFGGYGVFKYRAGMVSLVILMIIGTLILTRVKEAKALRTVA